ncbi:MAG TPA: ATP-binding protein, partial [Bradyrhizobium sp.]|nr:ATP-binding protein [Bradyrhizobium sp.]
ELRWVRSYGTSVLDEQGRPAHVVGVNVDITEERRREEGLRELAGDLRSAVEASEKERNKIYELSNDLFAVAGFDGYLKTINPAWERLLGYSQAELLAKPLAAIIHPDDVAAAGEVVAALRAGEPLQNFEDRLITAGGESVWITWAAVSEGERFYAVGRDVTREREQEEALRQSQKMEAMGQLTGGVAHDFNNLLTPIVGSLDMLQRRGIGSEREQRLIAGAAQSAERARILVQRLLAFARRQPLQAVSVDVATLVAGMADLVESTTGPQIKIVVDIAENLPPARADPNQLEMALLNLSVNARDAMPDGGTLRITASTELIGRDHRSQLESGTYMRLSVADTGTGMDEATLARAIEPFFSTKGIGKGTGLGLSSVHGLASQLGGALTIQSRPGIGTDVELWLPVSTDEATQASAVSRRQEDVADRGVALLVDDEELVRMSTADMLSDLGFAVMEASSAEEAVQMLDRDQIFDVVVTDHLMPGMTGTDLARHVHRIRPELPVLLVSGYAELAGVDSDRPRLTKPFRKDELATTLLALLH